MFNSNLDLLRLIGHNGLDNLNERLLLDIMTIADEVDAQLMKTVRSLTEVNSPAPANAAG